MMKNSARWALLLASLMLVASLAACVSLAEDITPPPGYVPPSPQPTTAPVFPIVPPSPQAGAAIFAEKCAPCHGETGLGDGELAASSPVPPAALASLEVSRPAKPTEWFDLVTKGDMERMMPPFSSLDDRQRWDVVAYVFTLGVKPAEMELGQELYEAECATCHGESGQAPGAADWTDPAILARHSNQDLFNAISNGVGEMPAYAEKFSDAERWAMTAYVRSLSFAREATAAATPTPDVSATPEVNLTPESPTSSEAATATNEPTPTQAALVNFDITGKLNLPEGASLAAGTLVTLQGYDNMEQSSAVDAVVKTDGSFSFEDVEPLEGRVYLVVLTYDGVIYSSDPIHMTDLVGGEPVSVQISIADSSTDTSALTVERMHVFFDFPVETETLQVVELYVINNPTDKIVVSQDGQTPIVSFELPEGAMNLAFQDGVMGGRFIETATGFGDTEPIPPGGGFQILFAYELPYTNKLKLELPISLPVQAAVVMAPEGLKLKSDQLISSGPTNMQGMSIEVFTASNLQAGSRISMNLSGRPSAAGAEGGNTWLTLLISGLVLAGALGGAGWMFLRQRKSKATEEIVEAASAEESVEDLMDAIITLDDLYQAGNLPREAYDQRRSELKERLARRKATK